MGKRIRDTGRSLPRIQDQGSHLRPIHQEEVADALGARKEDGISVAPLAPLDLPALVALVRSELVSTGGRPGRREPVERKKIPLTEREWNKLNDISEQMRELGVNAAPGQVASMLLRYSLDSAPRKYRVSDGQADDVEEMADRILAAAASAGVSLTGMRPVAVELLRQMLSEKRNESADG